MLDPIPQWKAVVAGIGLALGIVFTPIVWYFVLKGL